MRKLIDAVRSVGMVLAVLVALIQVHTWWQDWSNQLFATATHHEQLLPEPLSVRLRYLEWGYDATDAPSPASLSDLLLFDVRNEGGELLSGVELYVPRLKCAEIHYVDRDEPVIAFGPERLSLGNLRPNEELKVRAWCSSPPGWGVGLGDSALTHDGGVGRISLEAEIAPVWHTVKGALPLLVIAGLISIIVFGNVVFDRRRLQQGYSDALERIKELEAQSTPPKEGDGGDETS